MKTNEQNEQNEQQVEGIVYFISYTHAKGNGNVEVNLSKDITHIEEVGEIQQLIEEEYSLKEVVINHFIPLRSAKVEE